MRAFCAEHQIAVEAWSPLGQSVTPDRIRENIDIFDFELSATDVEDIAVLNKNERTGPDPDKFDGR